MRGRGRDRLDNGRLERVLLGLSARCGGMKLLSHADVAPHAFAAANEALEKALSDIPDVFTIDFTAENQTTRSQHVRCEGCGGAGR
jgi:hypothetical protein